MSQNSERQEKHWLPSSLRTSTAGWLLFNLGMICVVVAVACGLSNAQMALAVFVSLALAFALFGGLWVLMHPAKDKNDN